MKKIYLLLGCLVGASLIHGCCFLVGCIGPSFPSTPYIDYWEKPGVSDEQKQKDWIACGGAKDGDFSPPLHRLPGKTGDINAYSKADRIFQRCLIGKGYWWKKEQCIVWGRPIACSWRAVKE